MVYTYLHNQAPVLFRLTEVGAHFKYAHSSFLTQTHPALILFTLWKSIPKCFKDLPNCFLAHCRNKKYLELVQRGGFFVMWVAMILLRVYV